MEWQIDYYTTKDGDAPVKDWLDNEISINAKANVFRVFMLLKTRGLSVGLPHIRPLENKLFEVRAKDKDGIYRVIYFAHTGKRFIMLHGFTKKTEKTPRADIEISLKRMKEYRDG